MYCKFCWLAIIFQKSLDDPLSNGLGPKSRTLTNRANSSTYAVRMNSHTKSIRRWIRTSIRGCLLLAVLLLGNGCVYWRLNQFRHQLSAFPDHFQIEEGELPRIVALRPILRPDDLGWLSGLEASEFIQEAGREIEIYRYVKQYMDGAEDEQGAYDMVLSLHFNDRGRVEAFEAPAQFASILTEENFDEVFRPMKDGTIERDRHATGWWWEEHRVNIPLREDIVYFFGQPSYVKDSPYGVTYHYAYFLEGNERRWNPSGWDAYTRFIFDPEDEQVVFSETFKGRLHIIVDLRAERNLVQIERLSRSEMEE